MSDKKYQTIGYSSVLPDNIRSRLPFEADVMVESDFTFDRLVLNSTDAHLKAKVNSWMSNNVKYYKPGWEEHGYQ